MKRVLVCKDPSWRVGVNRRYRCAYGKEVQKSNNELLVEERGALVRRTMSTGRDHGRRETRFKDRRKKKNDVLGIPIFVKGKI